MIVAFALFASLLVVSAAPASAATVVVSSHDTDEELRAGTIENLNVIGSGADAHVAALDEVYFGGEEDGSYSEWWGDTTHVGTGPAIAPVGDTSIRMKTDGSKRQITRFVPTDSAPEYSFYVADTGSTSNNEILFNASGATLWGIFVKQGEGIYWSATEERSGGTPINTTIDVSDPHEITITNIDPSAGDVEILVDGVSAGRFPYFSSGGDYPERVALNTNTGTNDEFLVDGLSYARATGSGTYVSATHSGTNITTGSVNLTLSDASATVAWQALDNGSWTNVSSTTYSSSGIKLTDLSNATDYRVHVTLDRDGSSAVARIESDQVLSSTSPPSGSGSTPTGQINSDAEFAVNVTDADFVLGSESVTATLVINGNDVYSEVLTANGTASTDNVANDLLAGENNYHWRLTDSFGLTTTTDKVTVSTPALLSVFNATKTNLLVHDVTLTIQFFDEDRVYEQTTTDGRVSLAGLPAGSGFIVSVQPDQGYIPRRAIIDSIYEQQSVYILPQTADAAEVRFALEDPTGQFPPEETTLLIERPITKNGETTYQAVAGDNFGATGSYSSVLQTGTRYRLRVRTDSGEASRTLGSYTVYGPSSETLQIQQIEPASDVDTTGAIYGGVEQRDSGRVAAVRFVAGPNSTVDSVTYRVVREDGSVLVPNTTNTAGEFADIYPLVNATGDASYTIHYWIDTGDTQTSGEVRIGAVGGIAHRFNVDPQVLSIISWIAILATMGLLATANTTLAPAGGVGMATALSIMGFVAIPMPLLGVSGAISVLVLVGDSQ